MTAAKLLSVLALRIAMRLNSLSLQRSSLSGVALVDLHITLQGHSATGFLCNCHLAALCQQALLQPICIKCFVGQQCQQSDTFEQPLQVLEIMPLAW